MAVYRLLAGALALASSATAMGGGRPGYGLIGYGITMYDPVCAYACYSSVPTNLDCSDVDHSDHHMSMSMTMTEEPSPECLVSNEPFLTTLAWCMSTHCAGVEAWKLEKYWVSNVAGRMPGQPVPKISYQQALDLVREPPAEVLPEGDMLHNTTLVSEETWRANYNANYNFEKQESRHSTYSIVIVATCVVFPIFMSFLRFLPVPASAVSKFKAYVIDPPAFGSSHAAPVLGLGLVPTRGQALFAAYIVAINVILSGVGIEVLRPNSWFPTASNEVIALFSNRTGVLSMCNLPLVLLYAGRNNFLLWLTNWSHSTFLLLHRWVAVMCVLEACVHSAVYLADYVAEGTHSEESRLPYWWWGIIGTLALALLLPLSALPLRRIAYRIFLPTHIVLSILALVGTWYHIIFRFGHQWGYETWMYAAFAVWAFDRLFRMYRLLGNGVKRAFVTQVDDDYLRIHIPGADCHGHVYAFFPTLSWRIWENHPFSALHAAAGSPETKKEDSPVLSDDDSTGARESKTVGVESTTSIPSTGKQPGGGGVVLFVRRVNGITSRLASAIGNADGIPVLLEASYSSHGASFLQEGHDRPTTRYPDTLCIAGGVGITGVLPALDRTSGLDRPLGTTKLYWGVRTQALVDAVEGVAPESAWAGIEKHVHVGDRMDVRGVLDKELSKCPGRGTTVIVCGPPAMADEVRCAVAALGRHGAIVRLVEESFSW